MSGKDGNKLLFVMKYMYLLKKNVAEREGQKVSVIFVVFVIVM